MSTLLSTMVTLACFMSLARAETAALAIGETFTVESAILHEVRRINVYAPPLYAQSADVRLPVLYMPDGGIGEDFFHIAGLVQISAANGTMRPFLLVGIENTQRRRDLTGPTANEEDRKIAPEVGGSAAFRSFLRDELIPLVEARYRTTRERAIVGESLAGLFVVESFLLEPKLFDTCIALDPSLWWNDRELLGRVVELLDAGGRGTRTLFLANSQEPELAGLTRQLANLLGEYAGSQITWYHVDLSEETHATLYHPAALRAFRTVFGPTTAD